MATGTKILRVQSSISSSLPVSQVTEFRASTPHSAHSGESELLAISASDLFLFFSGSDGPWTAKLVERLCEERFGNHNLRLSLGDWNSARTANTAVETKKFLGKHRVLGIVVSKTMLREDWPAAERMIQVLKTFVPAGERVITILRENVTLPPVLRLGEWFDFRNEKYFEESCCDVMSFLREDLIASGDSSLRGGGLRLNSANRSASVVVSYSFGVSQSKERILSNLFPVIEVPKFVFSAETRFRTESELTEACAGAGPLPFLLKGSRLYTIEPLSRDSVFAPAASSGDGPKQENFAQWLSRNDRAGWAVELLNNLFRHHAWKRGLRCDERTEQYYFPRSKPKIVWWQMNRQLLSREVIAPHMEWIKLENQARAEVQRGWRHQSIRAAFIQVLGKLFLRLEPSCLLTEWDGKTLATNQPEGSSDSGMEFIPGAATQSRANSLAAGSCL